MSFIYKRIGIFSCEGEIWGGGGTFRAIDFFGGCQFMPNGTFGTTKIWPRSHLPVSNVLSTPPGKLEGGW